MLGLEAHGLEICLVSFYVIIFSGYL